MGSMLARRGVRLTPPRHAGAGAHVDDDGTRPSDDASTAILT